MELDQTNFGLSGTSQCAPTPTFSDRVTERCLPWVTGGCGKVALPGFEMTLSVLLPDSASATPAIARITTIAIMTPFFILLDSPSVV